MKLVFWSLLIIAAIWWLMKKGIGCGNDLTAHFAEQKALASVGNSALGANQISNGNNPLAFLGQTAFAGLFIDPLNPNSPFSKPNDTVLLPGTPANPQFNDYLLLN